MDADMVSEALDQDGNYVDMTFAQVRDRWWRGLT